MSKLERNSPSGGEGGRPACAARPRGGYRFVEAMRSEDGLLRTLNSDGCWEEWVPVKQAAQMMAKLFFLLVAIALSLFLLGMLAQWVKEVR